MASITAKRIYKFLTELATRYTDPAVVVLLGGGALCLLGSERPTVDIDYVGDDLHKNALQIVLEEVADEFQISIEPVPIEQFVPIPTDADSRHIQIGYFGQIEVYALDPYTIALSKLDRGFDSDLEDIQFLLHRNLIVFEQLEAVVEDALQKAIQYDLSVQAIRTHLDIVRSRRR